MQRGESNEEIWLLIYFIQHNAARLFIHTHSLFYLPAEPTRVADSTSCYSPFITVIYCDSGEKSWCMYKQEIMARYELEPDIKFPCFVFRVCIDVLDWDLETFFFPLRLRISDWDCLKSIKIFMYLIEILNYDDIQLGLFKIIWYSNARGFLWTSFNVF